MLCEEGMKNLNNYTQKQRLGIETFPDFRRAARWSRGQNQYVNGSYLETDFKTYKVEIAVTSKDGIDFLWK